MLPFEKNIATEITIIDDNLLPTGYYELTFDFFSVSIYFIYSMIVYFLLTFLNQALPVIYAVYKSAKETICLALQLILSLFLNFYEGLITELKIMGNYNK